MLHPQGFTRLPFSPPYGFNTLGLAHVLDSLVRVSRRVVRNRFVSNQVIELQPCHTPTPTRTAQQAEPSLVNKGNESNCSLGLLQAIPNLHTRTWSGTRSSRG